MHDAGSPVDEIEFYKRTIDRGPFTLRNYVFISCSNDVYFCPDASPILLGYGQK